MLLNILKDKSRQEVLQRSKSKNVLNLFQKIIASMNHVAKNNT